MRHATLTTFSLGTKKSTTFVSNYCMCKKPWESLCHLNMNAIQKISKRFTRVCVCVFQNIICCLQWMMSTWTQWMDTLNFLGGIPNRMFSICQSILSHMLSTRFTMRNEIMRGRTSKNCAARFAIGLVMCRHTIGCVVDQCQSRPMAWPDNATPFPN